MKNLIYFLFLSLLCFSCGDPCDDVVCGPGSCVDGTCICPDGFSGTNCEIQDLCFDSMCSNGTCNPDTGDCDCDDGYEGATCDTKIIDRYIGSWLSNDFECDNGFSGELTFVFIEGATVTDLQFYDTEDPDVFFDVLYDGDQLTVPAQDIDGIIVSGTGAIDDNNVMTLSLSVIDGDGNENKCMGSFILQ